MRHFQRLTKDSVRAIILAFKAGESQASIARRFQIDDSTVRYHVQKFESSYIQGLDFHSMIKVEVQFECIHPSSVCLVCGKLFDELLRHERQRIAELERELAQYRGGQEIGVV